MEVPDNPFLRNFGPTMAYSGAVVQVSGNIVGLDEEGNLKIRLTSRPYRVGNGSPEAKKRKLPTGKATSEHESKLRPGSR